MPMPTPRTIGIFVSSLDGGGVTWAMYRLALGLKKQGLDVCFYAAKNKGALKETISGTFKVIDLKARSSFLAFPALTRALATAKPDIFISNILQGNLASVLARGLARLVNKIPARLILIDHALLSNELALCPPCKRRIEHFLLPLFYARADKVVAVSQAAARDTQRVARLPATKIEVIYNAVIPDDFDLLCAGEAPHPWLQNKNGPILLGVGRLNPEKGFADLVRALARVRQNKPARLILVGEGPQRPALEALVRDLDLEAYVSFAGYQTPVFSWIKQADLLVQPSLSEAFGNTIVESLACGTPVVSTRSGGPAEILQEGRYGRLVPTQAPDSLAGAILQALNENPDKQMLRERGHSFSLDHATEKYMDLFLRLLREPELSEQE